MSGLLNQYGQPLNTGRYAAGPSRDAGAYRGTIANWNPSRLVNMDAQIRERLTMQRRAADLAANDWAAKSGIRTIADNAVGTGLVPKSSIPHKLLGISREEAVAIGEKMEWVFSIWSQQAHARGIAHFEDLQYLGITSVLRQGEMLHLPVILPLDSGRVFGLAIQDISPTRLCTPADKRLDLNIKDGIEFTSYGKPQAYWLACPPPSLVPVDQQQLFSDSFIRRAARLGHRPNVFHLFRYEEEEQVRGVSALSNGMKLFRNLNDALDSELFSQVIAASFPVFVGLENGTAQLPPEVQEAYGMDAQGPVERVMEFGPGTVTFGNPNEKPYVLKNERPSANFPPFVEIILRSLAAMLGIPYESLAKDFSKTNYSSMRAALNEAWKLYMFYRRWYGRLYTQPIWEMVIEEAYLRNFLGLADAIDALSPAAGFYEGRQYWCSATWVGPARGSIDPVKEIQATIMALEARLATYGEAWAERGGDFSDALPVMEEELIALNKLPKPVAVSPQQATASKPDTGRDGDGPGEDGDGGKQSDQESAEMQHGA
ncbi:phage portal protein [uncultured Desulfovibrio sp.]|uniref:phage portal protein n=1 Tax=uncultured Desulfovibrio sp. TaxID=167968 RepID=UPI00258F14CC|nr:phage portal protein [uncultured Desulfovibrio sp.]